MSLLLGPASATSRIKDIADFEGVRENQMIGYGLVVGLNGTGDSLNNSPFTRQSLQSMLERMGVNTVADELRTANVAAVMVTANLPAFATPGTRIDVSVSALGDSNSLQGGTLLVTPMMGADGQTYAIAQGSLAVGGFTTQGDAATLTRGVPTSARISNGALVEREVGFKLATLDKMRIALRNPDFTTARRMALAINDLMGQPVAEPMDPGTVQLYLPKNFDGNIVDLLTDIEQLLIEPDLPAKVVIDEDTGVIVMGRDVQVSTVAVAQGNLTVMVSEFADVSQPAPFSDGETTIIPNTEINVGEDTPTQLAVINSGVSLQELVDGLNMLGIGPRDMISILQAIKAAGALQAEIEVM
ncbi:MAG: flagellar basal body P-ring protein FlgI [Hyphomicrobiales bacterium]